MGMRLISPPKRPVGISAFHLFMQKVWDRLWRDLVFLDSPTVKVNLGPNGIWWDAKVTIPPPSAVAVPAPAAVVIQTFAVLLVEDDYVLVSSGGVVAIAVVNAGFFSAVPQVNIAPPPAGGTQATATAVLTGTALTSVTVTSQGSGYVSAPAVTFTPNNFNATAVAAVGEIPVAKPPLLRCSPYRSSSNGLSRVQPNGTHQYQYVGADVRTDSTEAPGFTGVLTVNSAIMNGYLAGDIIFACQPTGGTGAMTGWFTITSGGSGYTTAPAVTFSGGGGGGASATAVVQNGKVVGLVLTDAGSGYTSIPTIAIAAPSPGPGATATAVVTTIVNGSIGGVTITWQDMNVDGRDWVASLPSCYGGLPDFQLAPSAPGPTDVTEL